MKSFYSYQLSNRRYLVAITSLIPVMLLVIALVFANVNEAGAAGELEVNVIVAPNLVVDSNVLSPSTYAPKVATVIGEFCNTSNAPLTDVTGYIGDGSTPGTYPSKTDVTIGTTTYNGTYSFTHLGGAPDATRYMGTLNPGQCLYQYWSFEYPQTATSGASTIPAWGTSVKADDDLFLDFHIWGTSSAGTETTTPNAATTMHFRNEISAMANKIKPNGNPAGQWFNTDTSTIYPGETISTNGVLYRIGNVNQGFDNDGDGAPDYNAWVQPFGDPAYDPSCFRLVSSSGTLTVTRSAGNPDLIINFTDQLYFTGIPADNTDVRGVVYYEFLALGGSCTIPITPYQEVASGSDNEKFNGDYGTGVPSLMTYEPLVSITKAASPNTVAETATINYTIGFSNDPDPYSSPPGYESPAGITLSSGGVNAGLMISDTVPFGLTYNTGTAAATNSIPTGNGVTIRYSTNGGATWSGSDPGNVQSTALNPVVIQWWLTEPLDTATSGNNSGNVTYSATVTSGYLTGGGDAFVENCATSHFGDGAAFAESCDTTMVEGTNSIGDYVWADVNNDGNQAGETGINGVDVWLYWDKNDNGILDVDEAEPVATTTTATNVGAGYYEFIGLPPASYIVKVDMTDVEALLPGYNYTTPKEVSVPGLSGGTTGVLTVDTADFGFGPILDLTKSLTNGQYDNGTYDNLYQGQLANYTINVINNRPGGTPPNNYCEYTIPAGLGQNTGTGGTVWASPASVAGFADGNYAIATMSSQPQTMEALQFNSASHGVISSVKLVLYTKEIREFVAGDNLEITVSKGATPVAGPTNYTGSGYFTSPAGTLYEIEIASWSGTWNWSDFNANAASPINILFKAIKSGSSTAQLGLDSAVFVVTTTETCGDSADTLNPVPVTDTYNSNELEFVSAKPPISSQSVIGPGSTLTWNNVGPLEAGDVQPIEVVFKVLANTGIVNNAGTTTGAKYLDGRSANDANDNVNADVFDANAIGDLVWFDTNGNGSRGAVADEPGLAGVVVELRLTGSATIFYNGKTYGQGDLIATTTTDANGAYLFEGIPGYVGGGTNNHDYSVTINRSASPILSGLSSSTTGGDVQASLNMTTNDDLARDFGYTGNSIVYGSIWHDKNDNAYDPTIDTNESYISGVTVYLSNGICSPITTCPSTTTDENGRYQFTNVPLNTTYTVVVDPPGTQVAGPTGEDTKATCITIGCTVANVSPSIVVGGTPDAYGGYDFGYQGADIGDTLYVDWNANGSQDESVGTSNPEEGIPNIDVYLYRDVNGNGIIDPEDTRLETDTTDSLGNYLFADYPAGNYIVVADTGDPQFPGSYVQTGDPDATFDNKHSFTTDGIADQLDVDFGYQPQGTSSIGDYVWADSDGDGQQDANETGIQNVTVTLYQDQNGDGVIDPEDAVVATATTGANGDYLFDNLAAGNYIVKVDNTNFNSSQPLEGLTHTNAQTGVADNLHKVALGSNENYEDADFGYTSSSIGDLIWMDNNGDGLNDAGEPGIPGVIVNLYVDADNDGIADTPSSPIATDTTDADGLYLFKGLAPNNYIVIVDTTGVLSSYTQTGDPDAFTQPCAATPTAPDLGCNNQYRLQGFTTPDSVFFPGLQMGQNDMSADFGYKPQGVVGDTLWVDTNDNGVRDAGEPALTGVTVELRYGSCTPGSTCPTTTTDASGVYSFGGLLPSTAYSIAIDESSLPTNMTQTYDGAGGTSCTERPVGTAPVAGACSTVTSFVTDDFTTPANGGIASIGGNACASNCELNVDFGYRFIGTNEINGTVWYDADSGQDIDAGETVRYEDVLVYLWDCGLDGVCNNADDIPVATTLTAVNGTYSFPNLPNGKYRVSMDINSDNVKGFTSTTGTLYNDLVLNNGTSPITRNFGVVGVLDLGDLPNTYKATLFTDNGARHTVSPHLHLGTAVDSDPIGQSETNAGATANGDDFDGAAVDDEDGVTIQSGAANPAHNGWTNGTVLSGNGGSLNIEISSDFNWSGVPQVFMDFNGSGILTEVTLRDAGGTPITGSLPDGTHRVYFDIPDGTFDGATLVNPIYFRVRLSTTGGLSVTGYGGIGEVEDYRWNFGPTAVSLSSFSPNNNAANSVGLVIVFSLILAAGSFIVIIRRRRQDIA